MNCFLFSGLDDGEIKEITGRLCKPVEMQKGDELYRVGFVGILLSGSAGVIRSGDTGGAVTVRTVHGGDVFGAASVFGEWKEGKSRIKAATVCSVIYISEQELREIFVKYPVTAVNYIAFLSDRIRFLNRRVDAFSAGSAVQKLYEYLVSLSDGNGEVKLDFGLAELARRLKMGRSSLYRSISVLSESGLVTRSKNTFTVK